MPFQEITVAAAAARLAGENPPLLVDVREQDEWDLVHVEGAKLLPLSQWPALATAELRDPAAPLLMMCHHGGRSGRAADFLVRAGFTNVANISGGIDAWAAQIEQALPRH